MASLQRVLTVIGDPNDINTWSNIPYFFLRAGQAAGFLDRGLPLQPDKLKMQRVLWNGWQWLATGEKGGFQYSQTFLRSLFSQINLGDEPIEIISHYPLLPTIPWQQNWQVSYYLDATTKQVFQDYGLAKKVGTRIQAAALEQETMNYQNAARIICMSEWAARSVIDDYGVSPEKVYVIPGGANLNEKALPTISSHPNISASLQPLRLGFVGKDWQRKGLPFLLQIADQISHHEVSVEVVVVGPSKGDLPAHPSIKSLGFIDKSKNLQDYVQLVRSFHFGCLFSKAEAFGISNLECLRLGVPVLASNVGGIPATVPDGLGYLFSPDTHPTEVADLLVSFVRDPSKYYALRQQVSARAEEFSWNSTIQKFTQLWQGSETF